MNATKKTINPETPINRLSDYSKIKKNSKKLSNSRDILNIDHGYAHMINELNSFDLPTNMHSKLTLLEYANSQLELDKEIVSTDGVNSHKSFMQILTAVMKQHSKGLINDTTVYKLLENSFLSKQKFFTQDRPNVPGPLITDLKIWIGEALEISNMASGEQIKDLFQAYRYFFHNSYFGETEKNLLSLRLFPKALWYVLKTEYDSPFLEYHKYKRPPFIAGIQLKL